MAVNEELLSFIRDALLKGQTRAQIEEVLLRAGWAPDQVRSALSGYADIEYPIPVPRPRPYQSAREAFIYLVLFTTLYISAMNLGSLIFEIINRAFPDPAAAKFSLDTVRWSVSVSQESQVSSASPSRRRLRRLPERRTRGRKRQGAPARARRSCKRHQMSQLP